MLYGNVIFIKKSGGDGSKFPVTCNDVCIGRSDDCIIRIQNPLISEKHCQLTIESNGQARIKNLSSANPTILNGQPLGNGKHLLRQGDILKLGERLARWEYLPSSKYYHANSRSPRSLVSAVPRCQRNSEGSVAETSQLLGNSTRKQNRRFTETGRGSLGKALRITPGSAKAVTSRRQLVLRRSLQLKKFGLSPHVKLRSSLLDSSVSGTHKVDSSHTTPIRKSQKWEVKSVTPPDKVKSTFKNGINRKSTPIKMPMAQMSGENVIKSGLKNASKAPSLVTIAELPLPNTRRILSERTIFDDAPDNFNMSISPKSPFKTSRTPKVKINSQKKSLSKSCEKKSLSKVLTDRQSSLGSEENTEVAKNLMKCSTPGRYEEKAADGNMKRLVVKKCALPNEIINSDQVSTKNVICKKMSVTPVNKRKSSVLSASTISSEEISTCSGKKISSKMGKSSPVSSARAKCASHLKIPPVSSPGKVEGPSRGKKSIPNGVLDVLVGELDGKDTPRKKAVSSSKKLPSAKKDPLRRGIKRKLSAIASAERAAKKLKALAPTKPDKNKKAALLLLGKASGKLKVPQNSNTVIKKKIVKKAIKQFTLNKEKSGNVKVNRARKAQSTSIQCGDENKSPDVSSTPSTLSRRHSTPIGKVPEQPSKRSYSRKNVISGDVIKSEIFTPSQQEKKNISSVSSISGCDSMEVLHGSVQSKCSEKKSVSFSSTNSSFEYDSPNLQFDIKPPVSKRLRSRCGDSSSELTELSPFALGLTPTGVDDALKFKKEKGRRSLSMTTPKNKSPVGIIKSASTSKINRKRVAFSDKDSSNSFYLDLTNDALFNLNEIQTPDVTIDLFVSPLSHKNTPKLKTRSTIFENSQDLLLENEEKYESLKQSPDCVNLESTVKEDNSSRKRKSAEKLDLITPGGKTIPRKSPKNDLTDVRGVRRLMETPGRRKSPRNDLTDVGGVRRLMETPGRRKSPRNDLTDVGGVRQLMESPGRRKSPKNDLTDVGGVRRLMESPGRRKSPKNDLTDVGGVRRLMESPGRRKSPKNDLTDVRGVRRLMESPGRRKSPKNDLTDVRGVRRLMETPGRHKSPKNDLTDIKGVRRLMELPKEHKSPTNDLTDVTGVKQLLKAKSPKNDLSNVSGLDKLFKSPPNETQYLGTLRKSASRGGEKDRNCSEMNQLFSTDKINNINGDVFGVKELPMSSEKSRNLRKRTGNATTPALSSERPVLRRAAKASSKIVEEPDMVKTRRNIKFSSEVPVDQNLKVVSRGGKIDAEDEIEKTAPKTRAGSLREGITVRETRASSKLAGGKEAAKRATTPPKSPAPAKRTRRGTVAREKVQVSKTKTATESPLKKEVVATPKSKSRSTRNTKKPTATGSSEKIKTTRSRRIQTNLEAQESPPSLQSRSSRAQTRSKRVKEPVVSPIETRQRKAKTVVPDTKEEPKSRPVRTRRVL